MPVIDLNSDVGESFGNWQLGDDAAIFESVSSANVACGFHAGDPSTIAQTCRDAAAAGVTIGAHIAYRDLAGFGRRFLDCSYMELFDDVLYQLGALQSLARAAGAEVRYVKPHGALYNTMLHHEMHAQAVVDAVAAFNKGLPLLLLPGAVALDLADDAGLRGVAEAFADRNYNADGTLVSRSEADSVIHDAGRVTANMVRLATDSTITAVDGTVLPMDAASICVHGDTPGAAAMARALRSGLENAGVTIESFV